MTEIDYEAEYPGVTAGDALHDAEEAEKHLPFNVSWSHIDLHRFWEGQTRMVEENKRDQDILQEFREKEWEWVATLKAKGQTI